ncbi:cytochrome P450 family protein [Saccharopolyspora soli]|uniref:cytochrome P450 family protein n=1 Tax=Saccharopolyspora soli TaxID=2926618 RepID=UPI001F57AC04|nr:cytochrome P450 [Saccharopolyspora soli]
MDETFSADPYTFLARLRQHGPVARVRTSNGTPVHLVLRYAEATHVLGDHALYRKDLDVLRDRMQELAPAGATPHALPSAVRVLLNQDQPDHTRIRGLVAPTFTPRRLDVVQPRIHAFTEQLLDSIDTSSDVDLLAAVAEPLPIMVVSELLGVPPSDRAQFGAWTGDFVQAKDPALAWDAGDAMGDYLHDLIDRKRAANGDDLLTDLIRAADSGDRLSTEELVSLAFVLILAGHETTVHLLTGTILALLRHPEALAECVADPNLIPAAIEETLRWDPPLHTATYRYAAHDTTLGGTNIHAGDLVFVSIAASNRDPLRYPDPDQFDLHREDKRALSFGHGIHYCLGAALARLEGRIALAELLRRWPDMHLTCPPGELQYEHMLLQRALVRLPVRLHPPRSAAS